MNLIIHQTFKLLISLFIDFLDRGLAVNKEVTEPRFLDAKLKSSLRNFTVAIMTWLNVTQMTIYMIRLSYSQYGYFLIHVL
jgi:hypothetical protein